MSQSIITNTFIASAGRAINIVLGIVITAAITRIMGAESYGSYVLLLAYGAVLQIAADFGLYLTLTKEIARNPDREQEVYSRIAALRATLVVVAAAVGLAIVFWFPEYRQLAGAYLVVMIGLGFQSLSQLLMGVYQKHGVVWRATLGDLAGRLVQLAGVLALPMLLISRQGGRVYELFYMLSMFTAGAAAAYLIHVWLVPAVRAWRLTVDVRAWKDIARQAWPLAGMLMVNAVYFRIDTIMLSYFRSGAEVGWYGLAYRIIESGLFFPAMFGGLLLPRLSASIKQQPADAAKLLKQGVHFIAVAAGGAVATLVPLAQPAVVWLSGQEFSPAGAMLQVLSLALAIMFLGNLFGFTLVALEKHKTLLMLYLCLAGGNAAANLVFIPRFGAMAAAWTTVATEAAAMSVAAWLVGRQLKFHPRLKTLALIVLITAVSVYLGTALPDAWHVVVRAAVTIVFYLCCGVMLGVVSRKDIQQLIISP